MGTFVLFSMHEYSFQTKTRMNHPLVTSVRMHSSIFNVNEDAEKKRDLSLLKIARSKDRDMTVTVFFKYTPLFFTPLLH